MMTRRFFATSLLLSSLSGSALAMSKKGKYIITFHCQGDDMGSPRSIFKLPLPGYQTPVTFEKVPVFSNMQIAAIHSFPADDGQTKGLAMKLDFRGSNALDLITRTRNGEVMLAMINGQPADFVLIDGPITDGTVTIWRNVPEELITELAKKHPPINKLPSMSEGHSDMLPTTKGEKRDARLKIKAEEKATEAEKKNPKPEPFSAPPKKD